MDSDNVFIFKCNKIDAGVCKLRAQLCFSTLSTILKIRYRPQFDAYSKKNLGSSDLTNKV